MVCLVGKRGQLAEDTKLCLIHNREKILSVSLSTRLLLNYNKSNPWLLTVIRAVAIHKGPGFLRVGLSSTFSRSKRNLIKLKELPEMFNSLPSICMYPETWNLTDSPDWYRQVQVTDVFIFCTNEDTIFNSIGWSTDTNPLVPTKSL